MSETTTQIRTKIPEPNAILRGIHSLQLTIAVCILCLDVYGVNFVPYNALVCSCIASLCTIPVCVYLLTALSCFHRLYSPYIASAYHAWMLIFWVVDLTLIAQLAKMWSGPECTNDLHNQYMCTPYQRRQITSSKTTSFSTFYGAMVAGAVLAAFEIALWALTASLLFRHWRMSRLANSLRPASYNYTYPPQRTTQPPITDIPFQNFSGTTDPQVFHIPRPQDPWSLPFSVAGVLRGPIIPDTRTSVGTDNSRPTIDPLSDLTFGSPVSSSSEGPMGRRISSIPRDTWRLSRHRVPPGETSGPPSETEQKDWSAGSSLQAVGHEEPSARTSGKTSTSAKTSMSEGYVRRSTMDSMPFDP